MHAFRFSGFLFQVYVWLDEKGKPTTRKQTDVIMHNFILGNYHSSMALDNDDGSAYFGARCTRAR